MSTSLHSRIVLARCVAAACGTGVLLVGAAGCGSSSPQPASAGTNTYGGTGQQGATSGQFPGADGKVAAVTGSTAQVQSQQNGQVAVTWTSSTRFTKQVTVTLAAVKVGDCVVAMPAASSSGTSTTPTTPATAITAASVRITAPVNGSCSPTLRTGGGNVTGGGGFGGNPPAGGEGGTGPQSNGAPPSGTGRGQFRFGGFGAFGKVTALKTNGFTVAETRPAAASGSTATTVSVAVTTSAATTFSTTAAATASDVKVGTCVRATGKTDDTGAITATSVAVSAPVNGVCGAVFLRSGGAGGGFGGPGLDSSGGKSS